MIGDTAAISLLTGLPGSGKSLRMAEAISILVDKGEHVYACNIDGLKIPGVTPWEDARKWRDLPTGAILFVDEAQAFFPERRGGEPPEAVRMNKIRHDGIRIVLATQQPNYLDTYLRGLVGYHEHLLRRAGKQESFLFRENQVMDVVRQKLAVIKRTYDYEVYRFKPKYFACYDSAQTHTIKYQMPALVRKALMALPVVALMMFGAWYTVFRDSSLAMAADADNQTPPLAASLSATAANRPGNVAATVSTGEQYLASLVPLVADVPWTAPAFIGRPVQSEPRLFCMATANTCRCLTEQATRPTWPVRDDICRDIAQHGEPYNPYKPPAPLPQPSRGDEGTATEKPSGGAPALAGSVVEGHPARVNGAGNVL